MEDGILTIIKLLQPIKHPSLIVVTEFGILILVKPVHPEKQFAPKLVI
jgi:hypothetical protein